MRKLWQKIVRFFLFPKDAPLWLRLMPYIVLGILTALIISGSIWAWDYTNSTSFCGTSCHTMPPEYSTYQHSPHARVECVECHLGRDALTSQIPRKIGHSRTLYSLIFKTYEYPIVARQMRPASESCETCHFPEKFSDDSLREMRTFASDEANTPTSTFLVMKTGGGTQRQGLGRGIHWHIENIVEFYTTDDLFEQDIPYVRVTSPDGTVKEYVDIAVDFKPESLTNQQLLRMDCISCHNRVTHNIPSPEEAVDQALIKKLIPNDLPEARAKAIELLRKEYETSAEGIAALDGFEAYYAQNYPDVYTTRKEDISKAIAALKEIYPQLRYPEQELDWNSHPNNIGHKDSPGCFRCHDGKHLTQEGEAIRLECNICHSIPVVTDATKLVTEIEVVRGPEPASHTATTWMTLHGKVKDASCATCHPPADPAVDLATLQGKPPADGSFCGNSACHSSEWQFTGFDSPALNTFLDEQLAQIAVAAAPATPAGAANTYVGSIRALFEARCAACHSGSAAMAGLDVSSYEQILKGGQSGPGIVPGDPQASGIYTKQAAGGHFGQFTTEEMELLAAWIEDNAPQQ